MVHYVYITVSFVLEGFVKCNFLVVRRPLSLQTHCMAAVSVYTFYEVIFIDCSHTIFFCGNSVIETSFVYCFEFSASVRCLCLFKKKTFKSFGTILLIKFLLFLI